MRSYFGQLSCRHVTIFCAKLIKTSWFGSRKNSLKCSCNQKGTPSNSLFCNPLHIYLSTILTGVKSKTFEGCILSQDHRHNLWKRTRWQIHGGIAQRLNRGGRLLYFKITFYCTEVLPVENLWTWLISCLDRRWRYRRLQGNQGKKVNYGNIRKCPD